MKARVSPFILASTIILCLASPLHADTYNWNGSTTGGATGTDNTWDTITENWTGTGTTWPSVSTSNDDAVFGGTAGTVTLTTDVTANDITISPSSGSTYTIGADNTVGSITLDGTSPTITCSTGSFHNIGAVIHGSDGLIKAGSITLQLRGANDYSGDTQVLAGTLLIGLSNNRLPTGTNLILGDGNTNTSGVFQMNSRSQQVGGLETAGTGTGNRVINGSSTVSTFTVSNPGDHIFGGILGGTGTNHNNFNFTKSGVGRLTLTSTNTFTGTTTVSGGVLEIGHATDTLADTAPVNVNGGALDIGDNTDTIGALTITSGTVTGGTGVLSAPSCAGKAGLVEAELAGTTDLSGTTTNWLTKDTTGTLELASANTFTGNVKVTAGRLTLSNSQALGSRNNTDRKGLITQYNSPNSPSVWLKGGITLPDYIDIFASSTSADGSGINNESDDNEITGPVYFSTGNGALNISSSAGTLTISSDITMTSSARTLYLGGASENDNTISGNISENSAAIMPVIKQGTGRWILSGTNTYKGDTTVNDGTLVLASGGSQAFYPKTDGSSNKITGTATVTLDGALSIDLTNANTASEWLLVDVTNLDETYGTNFTVTDFTETAVDSGIWERTVGADLYTFTQADGKLTRGPAATDDYTTWSDGFSLVGGAGDDDDNDGLTNFEEYAFGLNPTSGASVNPISQQLNKGTGIFKYTRRAESLATDVTCNYESSTTLSGAWDPFTPDSVASDSGSPIEEITVTVPASLLTNPKLFIRVKSVKP